MSAHFPYHPRRTRALLTVAAACAVGLAAWALATALASRATLDFARAGVCGGLALTFLTLHLRLRPRDGWGLTVGPLALTLSRPFDGQLELPWSQVAQVEREKRQVKLVLTDGGRVLVPAFLFPDAAAFDAVVGALQERRGEQ